MGGPGRFDIQDPEEALGRSVKGVEEMALGSFSIGAP